MLAVEYRLAPEHPHPVSVEDSYAALCWLIAHAADLGVDVERIGVMGDSGGGGVAAGVALLACGFRFIPAGYSDLKPATVPI